jgi:putative hydrolase of the HAD superfamily
VRAFRAIVFDLDDTLYPEREYVLSGFSEVAKYLERELGTPWSEIRDGFIREFDANGRDRVFNRWLSNQRLEVDRWLPAMVDAYRNHDPRITLAPAVRNLLAFMKPRYRLALISDGRLTQQQKKVTSLELDRWLDVILLTDELGSEFCKPCAMPFEIVIERLGVRADEAVYVGDNPVKDFLGARRTGMATVRIRRRDGIYRDSEPPTPEHKSDLEIGSLEELNGWLGEPAA